MPGLMELAVGSAPLLGGVLLGSAAGSLKGPDVRADIKADLDLLDRIPVEQTERRARLQRSIDDRVDDLVAGAEQRRMLRSALVGYQGNWRDIVLFVCTLLFTFIWWHVQHSRPDWLVLFIALIVLSVLTGAYALRGLLRAVLARTRRRAGSTG